MELTILNTSPLATNTYLLAADGEAMVIDPGVWAEITLDQLAKRNLRLDKIVLTHGHFDHAAAARVLQDTGAKVYVYYAEEALNNARDSLAALNGIDYEPYTPNVLLHDGDNISFGKETFRVLHTPGHTAGGICLIGNGVVFSGDTLFYESVGRTDFPGGSAQDLRGSLKKLFALPGDYLVYPGHDAATTLEWERKHNPFAE